MENGRERNFYIVDSYCGPEAINPTVKAGTEELNFYSETDTYNRDNTPCTTFQISQSFIEGICRLITATQEIVGEAQKA